MLVDERPKSITLALRVFWKNESSPEASIPVLWAEGRLHLEVMQQ